MSDLVAHNIRLFPGQVKFFKELRMALVINAKPESDCDYCCTVDHRYSPISLRNWQCSLCSDKEEDNLIAIVT